VTIEKLVFSGSIGSSVAIHTGHTVVRGNRIRDVRYRPTSKTKLLGCGVEIGDFQQPGSLSSVLIDGNDIEINTPYDPSLHWSYGIYVSGVSPESTTGDKRITIQGNLIRDFAEGGILAVGSEGASILISDNQIDAGARKAFFGIAMHRNVEASLEVGPTAILDNSVLNIGGRAQYFSTGIGLSDVRHSRIEGNTIEISEAGTESSQGIRLGCWFGGRGSKNSSVIDNQVIGSSSYGLLIEGCEEAKLTEGNEFRENDLSDFRSGIATASVNRFTKNNSMQGISGEETVIDCGQENRIEEMQLLECLPLR
jgi:hypothetical protein